MALTVRNEKGTEYQVDQENLGHAEKDGYLPVVTNKDGKSFRVSSGDLDKAQADGYFTEVPKFEEPSAPSIGQSVLGGIQHGGTLGFSDNIAGATDALLSRTGNLFVPEGGQNPYENKPISQVYHEGMADQEKQTKAEHDAHPTAFNLGSVGGGVATTLPATGLKAAATIGGVAGLGNSDPNGSIADKVKSAILGAGVGAVGSKLGDLAGGAISKMQGTTPAVSGAEAIGTKLSGIPAESLPENLRMPDLAERPADWFFKTAGSEPQKYASPNLPGIPPEATKSFGDVINSGFKGGIADTVLNGATHGLAAPIMIGKEALKMSGPQQAVQKGLQAAAPTLKAADEAFQNVVSIPMKAFNKLSPGYQTVLKQAAEQGGRQLAITHFILGQRDPAYQDALKDK